MAGLLYRVAGVSFRRRRLVAAAWAVVFVGVAVCGVTLKGQTSHVFSVPGTQSQRALDLLDQKFPGTGERVSVLPCKLTNQW
jgi:RND superfamily putative drug exporter